MGQVVRSVLVIEDEKGMVEAIREVIGHTLATVEHIWEAGSLSSGLQVLQEREVDVVLLDLRLGDASGLQAMHAIRAKYPELPIVVLTGVDDVGLAIAAEKNGVRYLSKTTLAAGYTALLPVEMRFAMQLQPSEQAASLVQALQMPDVWNWRTDVEGAISGVQAKLEMVREAHAQTCRDLLASRVMLESEQKAMQKAIVKLQLTIATCTGVVLTLAFLAKLFKLW